MEVTEGLVSTIKLLYKGNVLNITSIALPDYVDKKKVTPGLFIDNDVNVCYDSNLDIGDKLSDLTESLRDQLDEISNMSLYQAILYLDGVKDIEYDQNVHIKDMIDNEVLKSKYWILRFVTILYEFFKNTTKKLQTCINAHGKAEFSYNNETYDLFKKIWFSEENRKIIDNQRLMYGHYLLTTFNNDDSIIKKDATNKVNQEMAKLYKPVKEIKATLKQSSEEYLKKLDHRDYAHNVNAVTWTEKRNVKDIVWGMYYGKINWEKANEVIGTCFCCDKPFNLDQNRDYHGGHIIADKKLGTYNIHNIRIVCPTCNGKMNVNHMYGWMIKNKMKGLHNINEDKIKQAKLYLINLKDRKIINQKEYDMLFTGVETRTDLILQYEIL